MARTVEQTAEYAAAIAKKRRWSLNPDREFTKSIVEGLTTNFNRYGFYLCPCRDSWGDRRKDRDIICPCLYAEPDISEYGRCFCALFFDSQAAAAESASIPDRRPIELLP